MDWLFSLWHWLPAALRQFIAGDLPSWLAVIMAVAAVIFALRRPQSYTELRDVQFKFDVGGGPVEVKALLVTASPAVGLKVRATLKLDRVTVPLAMKPLVTPRNYGYTASNDFRLHFSGEYAKPKKTPKAVQVNIRAKFSDGSSARFRERWLVAALVKNASSLPTPDTEAPQP